METKFERQAITDNLTFNTVTYKKSYGFLETLRPINSNKSHRFVQGFVIIHIGHVDV